MRLKNEIIDYLKLEIGKYLPEFKLYLFGSRADDSKKGGDIDLLLLSESPLSRRDKRSIKIGFYNKFGYQKVDLVSFAYDDPAPFKELALMDGIEL